MKRQLTPFLVLVGFALVTTPASAYCVLNQTKFPLAVVLKTYNPLGEFREVVDPGHKACCDWFDRRCNPSGRREGMVSLSVRQFTRRVVLPGADGAGGDDRYTPVPTYDRFGNPDPNGHFDQWGNYDEHGWKPYFERVETFNKYGFPDPNGHFDRYGVYDPNGHQGRRGRLVIPKRPAPPTVAAPQTKVREHFCVRGKQPMVLATGAGTVSVVEDALRDGGLRCESRDHFLRPVSPPSQASEFGVPIKDLPMLNSTPSKRRPQTPIGE
jgi:hypothetical protein